MALLLVVTGAGVGGAATDRARQVEDAIRDAVIARTGEGVAVGVEAQTIRAQAAAGRLIAVPEPSARSGRRAVFALAVADPAGPGGQRRIGSAVATVTLSGPHARTTRTLRRGALIEAGDVHDVHGVIEGLPLQPPLLSGAVVGGRVVRDLREGEIVGAALVRADPCVRSGDEVLVRVTAGGLEARGRAVASQSGSAGTVIRVVNAESRRAFKARVIGPGEVEVVHGH